MVDSIRSSEAAAELQQAERRKAESSKPTRSFSDVAASRKGGKAKKKKASKKGGPSAAQIGDDAAAARILGGRGGKPSAARKGGLGDATEGGGKGAKLMAGGEEGEAKPAAAKAGTGRFAAAAKKSALAQKGALAQKDVAQKAVAQKQIGADELLESKIDEHLDQLDDDLKSEVHDQIFASGIGHPLMAQRTSEPKPVEQAQAAQQIPQAIVDRVVERARIGKTADGAHEFQIDLKGDVFGGAEIKVITRDGKVTVEMVSDDTDLHQAAEQLAQQMKDKGINVDEVRVLTQAEAKAELQQSRADTGGGGGQRGNQPDRGAAGVGGAGRGGSPAAGSAGWSDEDVYTG